MDIYLQYGAEPLGAVTIELDEEALSFVDELAPRGRSANTPTWGLETIGASYIAAGLLRASLGVNRIRTAMSKSNSLYERSRKDGSPMLAKPLRDIAPPSATLNRFPATTRTLGERDTPALMWHAGVGALALAESIRTFEVISRRNGQTEDTPGRYSTAHKHGIPIRPAARNAVGGILTAGSVSRIDVHTSSENDANLYSPTIDIVAWSDTMPYDLSSSITAFRRRHPTKDDLTELSLHTTFNSVDSHTSVVRPRAQGNVATRLYALDAALRAATA